MKVQELSHPEISVLTCYDIEQPSAVEAAPAVITAAPTPKLRTMRIISLDDCAIPE
jgi:hypothetical protein